MVKVVVQRLVSLPELDHVLHDRVGREFLNQDARHKIRDEVHVLFAHTSARDLNCAHTQPTGSVPVARGITGQEVFVGHNIGTR
jgi:hypothetical protein